MKKSYIAIFVAFVSLALTSCERSILEPWPPDAARQAADIWGNYYYSKGVMDRVYTDNNLAGYWCDITGYGCLSQATDEAEHALPSAAVQRFTNGLWNVTNTPTTYYGNVYNTHNARQPWINSYLGMRRLHLFLEGVDGSVLIDDPDNPTRAHDRTYWKGQAYFFRAYLGFDLFRRYGRYVISTTVEDIEDPDLYRDRNTMEECVAQMLQDIDSAVAMLPLLWDEDNWHRANRTAAQALKSRMLLYYASPLYQGKFEEWGLPKGSTGDVQRWIDAADAAREAINDNDFYNLEPVTVFKRPYSAAGTYGYQIGLTGNLDNHECIYEACFSTTQAYRNEQNSLPSELEGCNGYTNPTQEMVDAFEVVTGKGAAAKAEPFDWNNPDHTKDPYANRDHRFYNAIMYNGMTWGEASNKSFVIYTYNALDAANSPDGKDHVGGAHRNKSVPGYTKTGYFYRKFFSEAFYYYGGSNKGYSAVKRGHWEFRFTELLLNYAEALNEAYGPDVQDPNGVLRAINEVEGICTARQAINVIRARVQMPALSTSITTKEEMREAIHHERQVELCFENHRFFDVRRWKEAPEKFGGEIHGIEIYPTKYNAKGIPTEYRYERVVVEKRHWENKYYWYPIPYDEYAKYNGKITQNPGW